MNGTGMSRIGGLAALVGMLLLASQGTWAQAQPGGALYGELIWGGFLDDLEELYRPNAGWSLGYVHSAGESWALGIEVGMRHHADRAPHGEGAWRDIGVREEGLRRLGPARDLRIIPWVGQIYWRLPARGKDPRELSMWLSAGAGGYSLRWEWRDPRATRSRTHFGWNAGAHLVWARSASLALLAGLTYHQITTDDLFHDVDPYHLVDLRLGVALAAPGRR